MPAQSPPSPLKRISLFTAFAIVVANMVGTGVFTSLGYQVASIPSGFPILMLWLIGGLLSFCGAVCYAELASMMPRSGGEYHLLSRSYHPIVGFLTGWISVTVGFAAPIAIAGLAFGKYGTVVLGLSEFSLLTLDATRLMAVALVLFITLVHLAGNAMASRFQVAFTTGKILLILALIALGWTYDSADGVSLAWQPGDKEHLLSQEFVIGLFWVMYAYTGWNAAAYVAGEVDRPTRNVPLALLLGTGFVTVLYVALNAAFLHTTPIAEMAGKEEVGFVVASHILGENGGKLMGGLIAFGLISTISSMVWAGPRVGQVMGEDYSLFRYLSLRNRFGAPSIAIVIQSVVVIALLLFVPFEKIVLYIQAILTLSSGLVVAAVIFLRMRQPKAPRPYRAFAYPLTPLLFIAASAYMLYTFVAREDTRHETLWGLLTLVAGAIVYWIAQAGTKTPPESPSE